MNKSIYLPLSNTVRLLLMTMLAFVLTLGTGQTVRAFTSPAPIYLGTAAPFAILAKTGISTTGTTAITGDLGVSPIAATAITGFSLIADSTNTFSTSSLVTGRIYASNYAPPTPANMTTAVGDMAIAYTDAASRAPDVSELGAGDISGLIIAPGVYKWGTGVSINTDVTLSGSSTDVWIFEISGNLTVASGAKVLLIGGAQASNIFWQVGGGVGVDIGTTAHVEGTILAAAGINLNTGATLNGRALSQTAVTLIANTVVVPLLPAPWVGSVSITSDKKIVTVARPHIGNEVASYDGFSAGALTAYIPMLFKNAFGGSYDSAFYIQNVDTSTANIVINYYDSTGVLTCSATDTVASFASNGYWLPGLLPATCLPDGWVGSVVVTSDKNIVAVARPHIGAEVMTYDSFSSGSLTSYLPMLFKSAFGGSYNAAFYVQNVGSSLAAITIQYYDSATGSLTCTVNGETVAPFASKGYWLPSTCVPANWVGGVVVISDQPIVTVARPHIGSQITTYNGFSAGATSAYVPMLFKNAFSNGSYDSAFYVQNVGTASATLTIDYYDLAGNLICSASDTVATLASKGYWLPGLLPATCLPAGLPDGWVGGVVITSDQPIITVGRPHIGAQVTTYSGFTSGSLNSYLPMLFKGAFGGAYNSAIYVKNTEASVASVTIKFYDSTGALTCMRNDILPAFATLSLWLPNLSCVH